MSVQSVQFGTEAYLQDRIGLMKMSSDSISGSEKERNIAKFDTMFCLSEMTAGWEKDGAVTFELSTSFKGKIDEIILPVCGITKPLLMTQIFISHPWFSDCLAFDDTSQSYKLDGPMQDLQNSFKKLISFSENLGKSIMSVAGKEDRKGFLARIGIDNGIDIESQIKIREAIFRKSACALKQFTYDDSKPSWNTCTDETPLQLLRGKENLTKKSGKTTIDRARSTVLRDFAKVLGNVKSCEFDWQITVAKDGTKQYAPKYIQDAGKGAPSISTEVKNALAIPELPAELPDDFNFAAKYNELVDVKTSIKESLEKVEKEIEALLEKQRDHESSMLGKKIAKSLQAGDFAKVQELVKLQEAKAIKESKALSEGKDKNVSEAGQNGK